MTGRYPHLSGGEGFYHLRHEEVPILPDILRGEGYDVGILGKVTHSTPYAAFQWDMAHDQIDLGQGRNPDAYYQHAKSFVQDAVDGDRPFFLMANSHDPHRPFYGNDKPEWYSELDPPAVPPSRTYDPEEVVIPEFLPDLPDVRLEIAEYYNSVRRCDDTVGRLLDVLDEAGVAENTLIIFLSDNGMAFPLCENKLLSKQHAHTLFGAVARGHSSRARGYRAFYFWSRLLTHSIGCNWRRYPGRRQWQIAFARIARRKTGWLRTSVHAISPDLGAAQLSDAMRAKRAVRLYLQSLV